MKKFFACFALTLFSCAFMSCNNSTDTIIVVGDTMIEETVDTMVVDSVDTLYVDTIL